MNKNILKLQSVYFKQEIEKIYDTRVKKLMSVWAEKKRVLPEGVTKYPGPWSNKVAPYLVEIMDCLCDFSGITEVSWMKGSQICATTMLENAIGFWIDEAPGPIFYITADDELAGLAMDTKVDPMLQSSGLQEKIFSQSQKKHSKKTGDTKKYKEFAGGFLRAVGCKSGAKLRSFAVRYLVRDEIDSAPGAIRGEGSFIAISDKRTDTYEDIKKILDLSTPAEKATSFIYKRFMRGDRRYYYVPCKHCGEMQRLIWKNIKWEIDSERRLIANSVHYECEKCGGEWKNSDKAFFLERGEWRPTAIPVAPNVRSYQMSSLYAPVGFKSWESIAQQWIDIQTNEDRQTFINLVLGEPWVDYGEAPEWRRVNERAEDYAPGTIPDGCLLLTLGADVQNDRIELEIVAWGVGHESWSVNYFVIPAEDKKDGTENTNDPCWDKLREIISTPRMFPDGSMRTVDLSLIDSSYRPSAVYEFCSTMRGVHPVQGDESPVLRQAFKSFDLQEYRVVRYDVNTGMMKDEIYKNLRKDRPLPGEEYPYGYCHFPKDYSTSYYKGMTAEDRIIKKTPSGAVKITWENVRQRKNEVLDCRVYALAATYIINSIIAAGYKEKKLAWPKFWAGVKEKRARNKK